MEDVFALLWGLGWFFGGICIFWIIPAIILFINRKVKWGIVCSGIFLGPFASIGYVVMKGYVEHGKIPGGEDLWYGSLYYVFIFALLLSIAGSFIGHFIEEKNASGVFVSILLSVLVLIGLYVLEGQMDKKIEKKRIEEVEELQKITNHYNKIATSYMENTYELPITSSQWDREVQRLTANLDGEVYLSGMRVGSLFFTFQDDVVKEVTLSVNNKEIAPTNREWEYIKRELEFNKDIPGRAKEKEENLYELAQKYNEDPSKWSPIQKELLSYGIEEVETLGKFVIPIHEFDIHVESPYGKYHQLFVASTSFTTQKETNEAFEKMVHLMDSIGINAFDYYVLIDENKEYQPLAVCNIDHDMEKDEVLGKVSLQPYDQTKVVTVCNTLTPNIMD
ncbi:hypothetical protein JOC85_002496 [Bacillus mesophilus]|uniref:Uncharacterized protein n=1 Tax=Bacillus mesophilus TaxID=1808955 RepID=A0A6M0Q7N2_9BACI|nr:UbiA family prenyltransferase [Bacillus mesophilus]MBM7661693.1 hypothetical protein [Bacillus mesophilus]NEY72355.1 hypothetical protein [Bacillus mesophilus]